MGPFRERLLPEYWYFIVFLKLRLELDELIRIHGFLVLKLLKGMCLMLLCRTFSKYHFFLGCVVPSWQKAVPGVCHSKFSTRSLGFIKYCPFFNFLFFFWFFYSTPWDCLYVFLVFRQLYLKVRNYYILRWHFIQSNKPEGNT